MAKSKKAPSKFEAIVEFKFGRGKNARTVQVPVTVKFADIPPWSGNPEEDARDLAWQSSKDRVVNAKELNRAYEAWLDGMTI